VPSALERRSYCQGEGAPGRCTEPDSVLYVLLARFERYSTVQYSMLTCGKATPSHVFLLDNLGHPNGSHECAMNFGIWCLFTCVCLDVPHWLQQIAVDSKTLEFVFNNGENDWDR